MREKFAPAWERLGYAHGLDPRPSAEGVAALETAMRLLPGRSDVILNLLLAYARTGNRESAEGLYLRLETIRADSTALGQAREILLQRSRQRRGGNGQGGKAGSAGRGGRGARGAGGENSFSTMIEIIAEIHPEAKRVQEALSALGG